MRITSILALLGIVIMFCVPVRAGETDDAQLSDLLEEYSPYLQPVEPDGNMHITAAPTPTHKVNVMPNQTAWAGESITVWGNSNTTAGDYKWEFGDSTSDATGTVTNNHYIKVDHIYTTPGVYTATLTILESAAPVGSDQVNITVIDKTTLTPDMQLQGDVNIAIENGLEYLYLQQNDGYWYGVGYYYGPTAFAVLAFLNQGYRAQDPDPTADTTGITDREIYAEYIYAGLKYLFMNTRLQQDLSPQFVGEEGYYYGTGRAIYETGMVLMAISSTGSPGEIVTVSPTNITTYVDLNGKTYREVAEGVVRYFAWAQQDSGSGRGGWRYTPNSGSDNSVAQWPVIGLQSAEWLFGISIPAYVKSELEIWLNAIQHPPLGDTDDGSSGYMSYDQYNNTAKTGAWLAQKAFVGDTRSDIPVLNAMDYIESYWNAPPAKCEYGWWELLDGNYYAVYGVFKGFFEISKTPGAFPMNELPGGMNWRQELDQYLVSQQEAGGSWNDRQHFGRNLGTAAAVLSLMRTVVGAPFVTVNEIDPSSFPEIALNVSVDSDAGVSGTGLPPEAFEILENRSSVTHEEFVSFAFDQQTQSYDIVYPSPNDDEDGTPREVLIRVTDPVKGVGFSIVSYTAPLSGVIVRAPDITARRGESIVIPVNISYLLSDGTAGDLANMDITSVQFTLKFSNVFLVAVDVTAGPVGGILGDPLFHVSNGKVEVSMGGANPLAGPGGPLVLIACKVRSDAPVNRRIALELSSVELNEGEPPARVFHGALNTETCLIGDVNGDESVTAADASLVLQYRVGLFTIPNPSYPCFTLEVADVSNSGTISALDAWYILAYSTGLIAAFPRQSAAPILAFQMEPTRIVEIRYEESPEGELMVPIQVDNLRNVFSTELSLTYDANAFKFVDVSKTGDTANNKISFSDQDGFLRVALAGGSQVAAGDVVTVIFERTGSSKDVKIQLTDIRLNEGLIPTVIRQQEIPESIKLWQNYPNPFNPDTWIPYQLDQSAEVEISIYDLSGKLIRTLSLGKKVPGFYAGQDKAAHWDGKNFAGERVSSGVYFYTLQAGDFTATKKLLLIK